MKSSFSLLLAMILLDGLFLSSDAVSILCVINLVLLCNVDVSLLDVCYARVTWLDILSLDVPCCLRISWTILCISFVCISLGASLRLSVMALFRLPIID